MKHKIVEIYTILFIVVIFLQIYYFINNDSEIPKERVVSTIAINGNFTAKLCGMIVLLFLFIIIFIISSILSNKLHVNKYLIIALIIISITNYVDCRLKTNVNFTHLEKDMDTALEESTTGDFVLCRSYKSNDILEFLFFRYFNSLYSNVLFSHIGIIIKHQNETYIIESTDDEYFCLHHKYKKTGPIMHRAKETIKKYPGRVHLCKNNLHKFINEQQVYEQFKKYEHQHFLQNGMWCVDMISNILSDIGVMYRPPIFYVPCDILNLQNYKVDYKQIQNVIIRNDYVIKHGV
jgi:hypothetical protein